MAPKGLYVNFTPQQLQAIQQKLLDWVTNGQWVSTGGAAKSGSKQYMDMERMQVEYNYAIAKQSNTLPPRKVVQNLTGGGCGFGNGDDGGCY
jgi:hypothetical protein